MLEIVTESLTNWVVNLNTNENKQLDGEEDDNNNIKPERDHDENKENIEEDNN